MRVGLLMMDWRNKVPQESMFNLQEKLKQTSDEKMVILSQVPLKSPIIGLILGIFFGFFAVDRFYKGDIGLGIAKLFWASLLLVFGM